LEAAIASLAKYQAEAEACENKILSLNVMEAFLIGEWRICTIQKPPAKRLPHSYGIAIESFDFRSMTFQGRSSPEGFFLIRDGEVRFDPVTLILKSLEIS